MKIANFQQPSSFKWIGLALAASLTFSTVALADEVKSDYDHSVNFGQIHTYSWGEVKTSDPLYINRVKQEVDRDLQSRGWQMVPNGGDVTVFAHGNVHNQQQLETTYESLGPGWGGGWGWRGWGWGAGAGFGTATTTTTNQPVAHLVIDIFNPGKQIIWRGIIQRDVSDKADKNAKNLDKDIDKLFNSFPPKSK